MGKKRSTNHILIVDADLAFSTSLSAALIGQGHLVTVSPEGRKGIEQALVARPDIILLDLQLSDISGVEAFETLQRLFNNLPIIVLTSTSGTEEAIRLIQKGAFDFLYKPTDIARLLNLIDKACIYSKSRQQQSDQPPAGESGDIREEFIGVSAAMMDVYKTIGQVADTDATILIRGESGTGKELAARTLYQYSKRADKPFIIVNCVAIPENLLESELFGYEKGAFTGANQRHTGKIESARGGTVFLDEIGDLPMTMQAKFLRLLQENTIERIGSNTAVKVDVRVIAATNRDLEKAVAEGAFRQDLYYRLKVVTLRMPPLCKRLDDIVLLTNYLLAKISQETAKPNPGITAAALKRIQSYHWPGNVRELANTLKHALIFNKGSMLQPEDIHLPHLENEPAQLPAPATDEGLRIWIQHELRNSRAGQTFEEAIDHVATLLIREAMLLTNGNRTEAAKLLGISRPTLHAKLEKYHIGSSKRREK